jgi:hypothetical protein
MVSHCEFTEKSRAAFWYDEGLTIQDSVLHGIKALRESHHIVLERLGCRFAGVPLEVFFDPSRKEPCRFRIPLLFR